MYYRVDVEAKTSEEFIVKAKNAQEAKNIAKARFMKSRNFKADIEAKSEYRDDL